MKNKLNHIISEHFDWDYIYAETSSKRELILQKITDFKSKYYYLPDSFIRLFNQNFPDWELTDWSQLYLGDRCLRILVTHKHSNNRYIFLISIFELFAVYSMSLTKVGDRYVYGDLIFINQGENGFCDTVYDTCMPEKFPWLDTYTLNTTIEELSTRNQYNSSVLVTCAKLLFTFHYNI